MRLLLLLPLLIIRFKRSGYKVGIERKPVAPVVIEQCGYIVEMRRSAKQHLKYHYELSGQNRDFPAADIHLYGRIQCHLLQFCRNREQCDLATPTNTQVSRETAKKSSTHFNSMHRESELPIIR